MSFSRFEADTPEQVHLNSLGVYEKIASWPMPTWELVLVYGLLLAMAAVLAVLSGLAVFHSLRFTALGLRFLWRRINTEPPIPRAKVIP